MLKLTRKLLRSNIIEKNPFFKLDSFNQLKNFADFSILKSKDYSNEIPEEVRNLMEAKNQQKIAQQLPILKQIYQIKGPQELNSILKKMKLLTASNRQIALKYLLSAIYQSKLPIQTLAYKPIEIILKQYAHLKFQTEIFRIKYLQSRISKTRQQQSKEHNLILKAQKNNELQQLFDEANNLYANCFKVTLKTVPENYLARSKALLYKHFAEYQFQFAFEFYPQDLSFLKKAREFFIQSLNYHKQVVLQEHTKLGNDETKKLKEEDENRHGIRMNAIKQNIRKLVQSMGECLYAIFKVISKQNKHLKDRLEHKKRKMELQSLLDQFIPFYSIVSGVKQQSALYCKLSKIRIEARFASAEDVKNQQQLKQQVKQTIQDYNRLYHECQQCFQQSAKLDNFNAIKDITMTIICNSINYSAVKYMIGKTTHQSSQQIKNSLAVEAKLIIDQVKGDWKHPMQQYLMQIIKELIKVMP